MTNTAKNPPAMIKMCFHLLLPIEASPRQLSNLEIVQHSYGQQTLYQQLMSLEAEVEIPKICDAKDVPLTVLQGQGSFTLHEEVVILAPGTFVFIPADIPHVLRTQTNLIFLLSRCEPDPVADTSAWLVTF